MILNHSMQNTGEFIFPPCIAHLNDFEKMLYMVILVAVKYFNRGSNAAFHPDAYFVYFFLSRPPNQF